MDKKTKEALRRYKKTKAREASSSDSSSSSESDSGTSSSYSSSDSDECKSNRRHRKKKTPRSEEERRCKREKREHCQKKLEAKRDHLKRKLKEAKLKKRAAAAAAVLSGHSHRSSLSPSTQAKLKKLAERKHLREVSKEGRDREKHRSIRGEHERGELHQSRSPSKIAKLRLHQDVLKQQQQIKSPQHMHQLMSREKIIIQARAHDRTPSLERSLRHNEHKIRHEDRRHDDRREREAARDKERAEALARCQERQRERERIAREKLRRDEEDQKKYGDSSGQRASTERIHLSNDREMMYPSGSNRGYNSRERSLEALERARYSTKRELDNMYERDRSYLDGIRHDRETLSSRRRETSPLSDRYTSRARDVREAYPEEDRESRNYGRGFQSNESVTPTHHSRDRGNWLDSREIREQDVSGEGRDYRNRDLDLMYGGESERLIRERKTVNPIRSNEQWKNNWNASREPNEWSERTPIISSAASAPSPIRKNDFNDGFKRTAGEMVSTTVGAAAVVGTAATTRDNIRGSSEADWDVDNHKKSALRAGENTGAIKKPGDTWWETRRDHDKTTTNANTNTSGLLGTEPCEPPHGNPFWQNEWHSGIMPTGLESNQLRAPDLMHRVRNYRERTGPMIGYRAQHPPPLMNVSIQPPQPRMYHGVSPRLPNKRNMTYTNPNLIKKQQQTALAAMKAATQAAATTAVAAAKAAAQSAANSTTNPGILGQVVRQQQQQQKQQKLQYIENKPEAGEIIENTMLVIEIKKNNNINNNNNNNKDQQSTHLIDLEKVSGELSEISDSDDEILNNIEKKPKIDQDMLSLNAPQSITDDVDEVTKIKDKTTTPIDNNNEMNAVVDEEDMLDFEEISDGELEEDARHKNIGDALGVDWASLVSENKEHAIENNISNFSNDAIETAKQRWQSHRILMKLGVSCAMAGEEFAMQLLKQSKEKLYEKIDDVDTENNLIKVKKEDEEDGEKNNHSSDVPKEDKELDFAATLQPYAFAQGIQRRRLNARKQIFANICGPFSRALSARKDLRIRRQLCNLPADDDEFSNRPIPILSAKIKNLAVNAFQCALQVK